jgi:hypothetical protein
VGGRVFSGVGEDVSVIAIVGVNVAVGGIGVTVNVGDGTTFSTSGVICGAGVRLGNNISVGAGVIGTQDASRTVKRKRQQGIFIKMLLLS